MSHQIEINAKEHKVSGVTLYQTDRAVIQRRFPVALKDGQNEISISRLPVVLEPDSLRVEVGTKSASPGLTVFDVVHVPPTYDYGRQYDVGSERGGLDEKLAALNARLTVLETQKSIFGSFGESLRASPLDNSTNGSSPVGTLEAFLDVFSTRHSAIYEETRSLETEKSSVQERMSEIQRKDNSEQEAWRAARLEFPSFYWLRRLDLPNWSCLVSFGERRGPVHTMSEQNSPQHLPSPRPLRDLPSPSNTAPTSNKAPARIETA